MIKLITLNDLKAMIEEKSPLIIDVRTSKEYETGSIPNSVNIPFDILSEQFAFLPKDYDTPIVVYCQSGNRSYKATDILKQLGYKNIYDFQSISYWK